MTTDHPKPTQPCSVHMNGKDYAWNAEVGLDPAVVLGVMGFIKKQAGAHAAWGRKAGLEYEDLVQEGVTGAIKAAGNYNPQVGAGYLTYARPWIDAAMKEALKRPLVRTPAGETCAWVVSLEDSLEDDDGRERQRDQEWMRADQPDAHDVSAAAEDRARFLRALRNLNARERAALVSQLGLSGEGRKTLQAIARELGVTPQRARQILNGAQADIAQLMGGSTPKGQGPGLPSRLA